MSLKNSESKISLEEINQATDYAMLLRDEGKISDNTQVIAYASFTETVENLVQFASLTN